MLDLAFACTEDFLKPVAYIPVTTHSAPSLKPSLSAGTLVRYGLDHSLSEVWGKWLGGVEGPLLPIITGLLFSDPTSSGSLLSTGKSRFAYLSQSGKWGISQWHGCRLALPVHSCHWAPTLWWFFDFAYELRFKGSSLLCQTVYKFPG